jgi:uracil-DNA glycosylase
MAASGFCPGYPPPYDELVGDYPGEDVYDPRHFRTEWGPIFHRGRLDGTARVLVIGQDPAATESIVRRILAGTAGWRTQGLLTRIGLTSSYVMVNTFVYSLYGPAPSHAVHDAAIAAYRDAWLDRIVAHNDIQAVITLGGLAATAYASWQQASGHGFAAPHAALMHPTYPESASSGGTITLDAATRRLLANWNENLPTLVAAIRDPDQPPNPAPYGTAFTPADLSPVPADDLPPGLPGWMRANVGWADRVGDTPLAKRATITVSAMLSDVVQPSATKTVAARASAPAGSVA